MKSDSFKVIRGRLLSSCGEWLQLLPEAVTHSLIALWQKICARLFAQYHASAHAYFQFLRLNVTNKVNKLYGILCVPVTFIQKTS